MLKYITNNATKNIKIVVQTSMLQRTWIPCYAVVNLSHKALIQQFRFVLLVFTQFNLSHLSLIGRVTHLTTSCCYRRKSASMLQHLISLLSQQYNQNKKLMSSPIDKLLKI